MADEKSKHSDTATGTSPLQRNEDVGDSTDGLSDSTDTEQMSKRGDDFARLVKSWFPVREDGGLAIPEVGGLQFPAPQNNPLQIVAVDLDDLFSEEEWLELEGRSGPAQPSNMPTGMFHKREANQHSPIAHQVQQYSNQNVTENHSFHPSILESSQACSSVDFLQTLSPTTASFQSPVCNAPIPPQDQTNDSRLSLTETVDFFQTLSPTSDPFQSPVCNAPIPPQNQTDESLQSLFQTLDFLQALSQTSAPLQTPVETARPISHLANEPPPAPMSQDQVRLGSRASGLAQASNASAGPFLKRYATQPLPTSAREVRTRIDLSVSPSAQSTPPPLAYPTQTAPVPPVTRTADFMPSLTGYVDLSQTLSPTNAPPPSPAQTGRPGSRLTTATRPHRISPDLNINSSPNEPKCLICRMDLALHPMVSTLPCGHRFHGICLNFSPLAMHLLRYGLHPPCPVCGRTMR